MKTLYGHLEEVIEGDELSEELYDLHVSQMTVEKLHSKAHIAGELAWRDRIIAGQARVIEIIDEQRRLAVSQISESPDW